MARDLPCKASSYFALQAASVVLWWGWLALDPDVRPWFFAREVDGVELAAFAAADGTVLVAGSIAAAVLARRGSVHARTAALVVLGALLYGTVWCVAASLATGEAWLAVLAMTAATVATALAAHRLDGGRA